MFIDGNEHIMEGLWEDKYFLAGSCARWFFGMNFEVAKGDIDTQLKKISNPEKYIANLIRVKNEFSANHLLSSFGEFDYRIVSEYVT